MALAGILNQAETRWYFPKAAADLFQRIRIGYDAWTGAWRPWSR
jgi:hypothetical protein